MENVFFCHTRIVDDLHGTHAGRIRTCQQQQFDNIRIVLDHNDIVDQIVNVGNPEHAHRVRTNVAQLAAGRQSQAEYPKNIQEFNTDLQREKKGLL